MVIAAGIGLAASSNGKQSHLRIGLIMFMVGWIFVVGFVWLSYRARGHPRRDKDEKKVLSQMRSHISVVRRMHAWLTKSWNRYFSLSPSLCH